MNCTEKILEPTNLLNQYTKSPQNPGSESPRRNRDPSPIWNPDTKS